MQTHFIDCWDAFEDIQRFVQDNQFEYVSLDTETNSVIERKALLWGVGICFDDHEGFYFPIRDKEGNKFWSDEQEKAIAKWIAELCLTHKLIGHNIIYDVLVIKNNWGYDLTDYIYADTILMKHLVDEERPFGLKEVSVKYIGPGADLAQQELYESIRANGGKTTKENMEMFKADTQVLGRYCSWDVMLTKKLQDKFSVQVRKENTNDLLFEEIMPLYRLVTIPMKDRGFPINVEHFRRLDNEITGEIKELNDHIVTQINGEIETFCSLLLNEQYPIKTSGTFPKILAEVLKLPLPRTPEGNTTLAKKKIEDLAKHNTHPFYNWLLGNSEYIDHDSLHRAQVEWYFKDNPDALHVFNLKSNNHLKWLFFEQLNETPISKTDSGEPQVDEDFLESIKKSHAWVKDLLDFKKLIKLKGTYIEGILDRQIDGVIYASMLQFGTSSGRYSSTNPNLQNLPRPKGEDSDLSPRVLKYVNAIREGFVAPKGYKLVDADQSALEPRCFAHSSGEPELQKIFHENMDMYSAIGIKSFNKPDASPYKKDPNYFGKLYPEMRQAVKTYCLAVTYGAEANRIAGLLNIERDEAQKLIDDYLNAFPGLKKYIKSCHDSAKKNGYVKNAFGRMRHLPRVQELYRKYGDKLLDARWAKMNGLSEERYQYKNGLNNSTNFPIQSLAAHIINRSAIAISKAFKEQNIDGYIALNVHDQLICIVKEEQAEQARDIVRDCMQNTVKIDVPLIAEPAIADNMKESH